MAEEAHEKSLAWVVAMLMLLIAASGWALAAAGYAHNVEGWRSGGVSAAKGPDGFPLTRRGALRDFFGNALRQIPNLPRVARFTIENRLWLIVTVAVLEMLVLFGGYKAQALEKELSGNARRRKSR